VKALLQLFVLLVCVLSCSCSTTSTGGSISVQAARSEARRDLQTGHPKIYVAGTIGVYEPGVPAKARSLVARLPRSSQLPMGCTNPHAKEGIAYAQAYNEVIVSQLCRTTH
jgi:hypothetical protein